MNDERFLPSLQHTNIIMFFRDMSLLNVYYLLPIDLPTPSGQGKVE